MCYITCYRYFIFISSPYIVIALFSMKKKQKGIKKAKNVAPVLELKMSNKNPLLTNIKSTDSQNVSVLDDLNDILHVSRKRRMQYAAHSPSIITPSQRSPEDLLKLEKLENEEAITKSTESDALETTAKIEVVKNININPNSLPCAGAPVPVPAVVPIEQDVSNTRTSPIGINLEFDYDIDEDNSSSSGSGSGIIEDTMTFHSHEYGHDSNTAVPVATIVPATDISIPIPPAIIHKINPNTLIPSESKINIMSNTTTAATTIASDASIQLPLRSSNSNPNTNIYDDENNITNHHIHSYSHSSTITIPNRIPIPVPIPVPIPIPTISIIEHNRILALTKIEHKKLNETQCICLNKKLAIEKMNYKRQLLEIKKPSCPIAIEAAGCYV